MAKGVLGSFNTQSLVDILLYMTLHLEVEAQTTMFVEWPGERSYLQYTRDVSESQQGLKNRKLKQSGRSLCK